MAVLIGMSGDVKGRNFKIDRNEITIGRHKSNTIILDTPTVSGTHCSVVQKEGLFVVRDLNSTNGTRLNSSEITEAGLKPKDLIQVGSVEFMFDAEGVEAVETNTYAQTQVEVDSGGVKTPDTFTSISPFGARNKESKGLWFLLIALIGVTALIGVVLFFIKLISAE